MGEKRIGVEVYSVLAAAVILVCLLMFKPIIGVADNGDFSRIMGQTGLAYISDAPEDRYFDYVTRQYRISGAEQAYSPYFSSEVHLVAFAKLLNNLFNSRAGYFDIRFLAAIYSTVLLAALYLLVKYLKQGPMPVDFILAGILIYIFTDVAYISYFNSLYGEAVAFSFLLLTAGLALCLIRQEKHTLTVLTAFFLASMFFIGAKVQYAPAGLLIAVFGIRLSRLRGDKLWKVSTVFFSMLVLWLSVVSYQSVPENIKVCNKYQTVFYGVLKDSPTPDKDLEELGLAPAFAVLAGTNYFMEDYPIDIKEPAFLEKIQKEVNPAKIALFYGRHPDRFIQKLNAAAKSGLTILQGFGNYEKPSGSGERKTAEGLGWWSNLRARAIPGSLLFITLIFTLFFTVLLYRHSKVSSAQSKLFLELLMLMGLIGLSQAVIPIVGDGEADISKHMFIFNVCFDMVLAALLLGAVKRMSVLYGRLRGNPVF